MNKWNTSLPSSTNSPRHNFLTKTYYLVRILHIEVEEGHLKRWKIKWKDSNSVLENQWEKAKLLSSLQNFLLCNRSNCDLDFYQPAPRSAFTGLTPGTVCKQALHYHLAWQRSAVKAWVRQHHQWSPHSPYWTHIQT